jgi:DUF4097 and DUF4098 domain-containing protein YvlB
MRRALGVFFGLSLLAGAQTPAASPGNISRQHTLRYEGNSWVSHQTGRLAGTSSVKIVVPARIRVTSSKSDDVSYQWTRRVRANTEADARKMLASGDITAKRSPEWCWLFVPDSSQISTAELTVEIPASARVVYVQSYNGSLSLKELNADIQAVTAAGSVEIDRVRGNVVARTGGGTMTIGSVQGSLRCLSGGGTIRVTKVTAESVLESAGGDIYVDEVGGFIRLSTAGNIHVGRAAQLVSAHTSGGLIEVNSAGGMVTAETGNGGITIGSAPGARCESGGGTIRIGKVWGSVRASTATGHLYVGMDGTKPLENSFLATERGDITVFLPSKLAVTVKALNESPGWLARFQSEFAEIQPRFAETGALRPLMAEGSLNGGGPLLMLSVANGSIYLKRRQ